MTAANRPAQIRALRELPRQARAAVRGLSEAQLDVPYREGGWTSRQVIHHLADSHMNAFVRMKLVATEEHPTLKPYDENDWAGTADGKSAPIELSLAILDGLHDRMARLLESLPESAFARGAFHPERGELTLADLLDTYADHGAHHLAHIAGLRRARGW